MASEPTRGLAIAASRHRVTQASPQAAARLGHSVSTAYRMENENGD